MFIDRAKIQIRSGKGGNGAVSFRKEPYVPEGGPDGGNGGKGGDVVFMADNSLRTLMDFKYKKKYQAEHGQDGMKKNKYGKHGEDLIIKVPPGTMVLDKETGLLMKDLVSHGDSFVAAKGGKGGKGNEHFKSSVRQAPNFAEAGRESKEREVILELKLLADVGLVGFPNVGKSSLLAVSSKAKPKVADYHFTTIDPNIGIVEVSNTNFAMADIAGIIEGAHLGAGLGFRFLKHIERTKVLIHVVDISGSEDRNPIEDFKKINNELEKYNPKLMKKPMIIAANKMDLLIDTEEGDDLGVTDPKYKEFVEYIDSLGREYKVFPMSAPLHLGVKEVLEEAAKALASYVADPLEEEIETFDFEKDDNDPEYRTVSYKFDSGMFVLEGRQLTKIFNSTNFNDLGSIRYLYKYIEKSGVIDKMKEEGLEEGDIIKIENFELEYFDEYSE